MALGGVVIAALAISGLRAGVQALTEKSLDPAAARRATDAWLADVTGPGRVRTDEVAAAVAAVGQSVAEPQKTALGERKARFVVVDDLQSKRALSLPDGTVVVSTGLLRTLVDESQLAAILAHGLAHIANGDVDDAVFRLRADDEIASAASLGADATTPRAIVSALNEVTQSSFSVLEETEADGVMLAALAKAGWSTDGLNTFIAELISKGTRKRPAWLLQHPENGDRAEARIRARADGRVNAAEFSDRIITPLERQAATPPPTNDTTGGAVTTEGPASQR
jgi:predicted Zn-dependent protease